MAQAQIEQKVNLEHVFHALVSCINALKRVGGEDDYAKMVLESVEPLASRFAESLKNFNTVHESLPLFSSGGVEVHSLPEDVWCRVDDVKQLWLAEEVVPEHLLYEVGFMRENIHTAWKMIQTFLESSEDERADEGAQPAHLRLLLSLCQVIEITHRGNNGGLLNYMEFLRKRTTVLRDQIEHELTWLANEPDMDANGIREVLRGIVMKLERSKNKG